MARLSRNLSKLLNPCHLTHPPLVIPTSKGDREVYGGSCFERLAECDIYVMLDSNKKPTRMSYPWTRGEEIYFPIVNNCAPSNVREFRSLIRYLSAAILDGKKVHIGCIGGHGRTGLVLAALYHTMVDGGDPYAITQVREQYCVKAVETLRQVKWLHLHYDQCMVEPSYTSKRMPRKTDIGRIKF